MNINYCKVSSNHEWTKLKPKCKLTYNKFISRETYFARRVKLINIFATAVQLGNYIYVTRGSEHINLHFFIRINLR